MDALIAQSMRPTTDDHTVELNTTMLDFMESAGFDRIKAEEVLITRQACTVNLVEAHFKGLLKLVPFLVSDCYLECLRWFVTVYLV